MNIKIQNPFKFCFSINAYLLTLIISLLFITAPANTTLYREPQKLNRSHIEIKNVQMTSEHQFNKALASLLNGKTEISFSYNFSDEAMKLVSGYIRIDIENDDYVIEGGLDKRSSLDSIQQAVFASVLAGKKAAVAVYDTDGKWGKIEHRIWVVSERLGIKFIWFDGYQIKQR